MRPTNLQSLLIRLAGYQFFVTRCCPTLYNRFACVGVLFVFHIILSSFTGFFSIELIFKSSLILKIGFAIIFGITSFLIIKNTTGLVHRYLRWPKMILPILIQLSWAGILAFALSKMLLGNLLNVAHSNFLFAISAFVFLLEFLPYLLLIFYRNTIYHQALNTYASKFYKS